MDRAIHRDARLVMARCISTHGLRRAQSAQRSEPSRCTPTLGAMASVAGLRSDSLMAFSGGNIAMICFRHWQSPLGRMLFTSQCERLTGVYFVGQKHQAVPSADWVQDDHLALFATLADQLAEYFQAERTAFDLPLAPRGTPFQQRVWEALLGIPSG